MKYQFDWKEYARIARQTVAEGCVLLKNDKETLPIKKGEVVSVFGRIQFDYYKSGTGSGGMVNAPYVVTILDGLRNSGVVVNEELVDVYKEWTKENPFDNGKGWAMEPWCQVEMPLTKDVVETPAKKSDLAVIIIGRTTGEDKDNSANEGSYLLTSAEHSMLELVYKEFSRVAVVLNVGNTIDMKWVKEYNPGAVLYAWQGGMEGGNGVADILTGTVNPCGKLSDTIAYDINDYPSTKNFGDEAINYYEEDIYVGYRYFETFAKDKVMYPFGYGLSYTNFESTVTGHRVEGDDSSIFVTVTNIGFMSGKEVVQAYIAPPQGVLGKPARNLIAFVKTKELAAGESQEVELKCNITQFASYDDGGYTSHKSCYVLEAGNYELYVGNDVRVASKAAEINIGELRVVEQLQEACAPVKEFKRMKLDVNVSLPEQGEFAVVEELVPTRSIDPLIRVKESLEADAIYTGNMQYQLADVYDKKISMEEFLAQLTEDELICMTRGEGMCSPKVTAGTAGAFGGVTFELQKYGIPIACCADGPSGIRMDCGTKAFSLPNGTSIACSFNTELVTQLFEILGLELLKNKIDTILGPGMNIHRNPLNGRNFEYFSEDPYLTGIMAVAELKGLAKHKVTGTIKHFACNNQEFKRHDTDSIVSERALREIYLKGYEMAVKTGGAYSIMSTYGAVNGLWTAGHYDLLTTILREEWGYKGIVMTDWWAKINDEGEPGTIQNTTAMVRAQNDVFMVVADALSNSCEDNTKEGLAAGKIKRAQLVRNARNICNVLLKSPVMDRFLDRSDDQFEEINVIEVKEDNLQEMSVKVVENEAILDVSGVNTDKGNNVLYPLQIPHKGKFKISFRMSSKSGELAQMPISIFMNTQFLSTVTINGTNGEWVEREVEFEVFVAIDNYLKLFFGEGGIILGEIKVSKCSE